VARVLQSRDVSLSVAEFRKRVGCTRWNPGQDHSWLRWQQLVLAVGIRTILESWGWRAADVVERQLG